MIAEPTPTETTDDDAVDLDQLTREVWVELQGLVKEGIVEAPCFRVGPNGREDLYRLKRHPLGAAG